MTITINMLTDRYGDALRLPSATPRTLRFEEMLPLPPTHADDPPDVPTRRALLRVEGRYAASEPTTEANSWMLLIFTSDGSSPLPQKASRMPSRTIALLDERDPDDVMEELMRFFNLYARWIASIRLSLLKQGGYQQLLDCCNGIFGDFICMTDSSFQLVAATDNPPEGDKAVAYLLEHGYHSEETVALFRKFGAIKRWETQKGITKVYETHIVNNPTLSYVFRMHGRYFIHIVLQCTSSKITAGLVDTFQLFIENIRFLVRHDWMKHNQNTQDCSQLFDSLIASKAGLTAQQKRIMKALGIAPEGAFRLYAYDPVQEDGEREANAAGYWAKRLAEAFSGLHVGVHDDRVVLLYDKARQVRIDSDPTEQLRDFCSTYGGDFGISEDFENMCDMGFAFKQANLAMHYGHSVNAPFHDVLGEKRADVRGHEFSDCFSQLVFDVHRRNERLIEYCVSRGIVSKLQEIDVAEDTNDCAILFMYLRSERRYPIVAKRLHMHRNTVAYRIERLQKVHGIDLESEKVRERILLEFELLSYS